MGWAARFLTAVSFLAAGVLFAPDALRLDSDGRSPAAARLVHLLAFATAWGAGLWVTFIGGIVMFKGLSAKYLGSGGDGFRLPETVLLLPSPATTCALSASLAGFTVLRSRILTTRRPQGTALALPPDSKKVWDGEKLGSVFPTNSPKADDCYNWTHRPDRREEFYPADANGTSDSIAFCNNQCSAVQPFFEEF